MAATKAWVNKAIEDAGSLPPGSAAPLNSPTFTGAPTAPTPVGGDDSTRLATTAFVQGELEDINERVDAVEDATTRIGGGPYAQVRRAVLLQGPLGAPVPTGSERAPQGLTRFTLSGVDYYARLQRVAGDSYQANERMRWLVYQVGAGDGSSLALVGYTASLALGHQGAGAFVDGGKAYFLSAMTTDASHVGADAGRGFSVTEWKPGFDVTTQSDVTNYQVFGYAGSGHALERFYNGTAFNSVDNKYWFLITASEDDTNARWCVRYSSAAIIAAGPGGSLNVTPEYMFPLKVPSEERLHILQDGCADADTIYASRGHLNAFSRHRIERYDYQGNPGKDIDYDSVRREYGRALLLDHPTLGTPFALEPEGVCINGDEIETLITDTWRTGPDIVSFEGKNWAALQDGMLNRKPWLQAYWVETTKAATAGAWNDATTYNASLSGAYTKREMVVYGIKPSTSATGEHPLDSGVMYAPGGASLRSGESAVDLQWVHGRTFQAKSFCMATNRYYEGFSYTGATLYLFDHSVDTADNTKKGRIGVNFSTGREYIALQATDFSGGASITAYGLGDSVLPGGLRVFYGAGVEGLRVDQNGQWTFTAPTAASGFAAPTFNRTDTGDSVVYSRNGTPIGADYLSTLNFQRVAMNGAQHAFARRTGSTGTPTVDWIIDTQGVSFRVGTLYPNRDNDVDHGAPSRRLRRTYTNAIVRGVRVVTASGAVTVTADDGIVVVNKTTGAATTVNLPAAPETGQTVTIKDGKGDANTNNITVTPAAGTIDGAATRVINSAYGRYQLIYTGSEWAIL